VLLGDWIVFLLLELVGLCARIFLGHVIVAGARAGDELDLETGGFGHGSCSLKAILGPLTGETYDDLDVRNGMTATTEFLRVMRGDVDDTERRRVRLALEQYCSRDTESLLWIISALHKLVAA